MISKEKEQPKPQVSRKKEMTKTREQIKEIETKKIIEKINTRR